MPFLPKRLAVPVLAAGAVVAAPSPAHAAGLASTDQSAAIDPVVRLADRAQARQARRHVSLARVNAKLRAEAPPRRLRARVSDWSAAHLRAENRELRRENRRLRRRAAAEAVAPPPHLQAIAACESGGDPGAVDPSGTYRGKYQFDLQTWASVGGSGDPAAASEAEQDRRAAMLYARSGATPWPVCGS